MRKGSLRFYDTTIQIWEEPPKCDTQYEENFRREVFEPMIRFLRARGWHIDNDRNIDKNYPSLAKSHRQGNRDRLQAKLEQGGRQIEVKFFQNVVADHKYGGE